MTLRMSYGRLPSAGTRSSSDVAAPVGRVARRAAAGGFSRLFCGQQRQQVAHLLEAGLLVVVREVRDAGGLGVHVGAAEAVLGDLLAGDRLDHVRAGDEHLRGVADHEHEVGERRASRPRRPRTGRASR